MHFRLIHLLKAFQIALICAIAVAPCRATDTVTIVDNSDGCFHHMQSDTEYKRQGNTFVSPNKTIPEADVTELLVALKESTKKQVFNPADLGITQATLQQNRRKMLFVTRLFCPKVTPSLIQRRASAFDYKTIAMLAEDQLVVNDFSTTRVTFSANIAIDNEPPISVTSHHDCPWMLPWTITIGPNQWKTYSLAVPQAFAKLAESTGPNYNLLDGTRYWQSLFWTNSHLVMSIGNRLTNSDPTKSASTAPGYAAATSRFKLVNGHSGQMYPTCFYAQLEPRAPALVNSVWWFCPLDSHHRVTKNWNYVLSQYDFCSAVAAKHKWLTDWRSADPGNQLQCQISGSKLYIGSDFQRNISQVWKDAGLKGHPEIQLLFREGLVIMGEMYLSTGDNRGLITQAAGGFTSHWFDKQNIDHDSPKPQYIVVQPDGTFTTSFVNKLPDSAPIDHAAH